jgi:hypothetical protein
MASYRYDGCYQFVVLRQSSGHTPDTNHGSEFLWDSVAWQQQVRQYRSCYNSITNSIIVKLRLGSEGMLNISQNTGKAAMSFATQCLGQPRHRKSTHVLGKTG